jgi:cyclophilin family peptidyl-prolyl cis-trans isomerase
MTARGWLTAAGVTLAVTTPHAQAVPAARVNILLAEARGATTVQDLATLRLGVRNSNEQTARDALRALGRLGRPGLIADIAPALRVTSPEIRAEAASAIASTFAVSGLAATGGNLAKAGATTGSAVATALSVLLTRLSAEEEPAVRAALCEALARIPFADTTQIARVEAALLGSAHSDIVSERLGVVRGFEFLVRLNLGKWTPGAEAIGMLRELVGLASDHHGEVLSSNAQVVLAGPARDARVRRLALETLILAGQADDGVVEQGSTDADAQVRRLAMKAAGMAPATRTEAIEPVLQRGLTDAHPLVRMEALRGESQREPGTARTCGHLVDALSDSNAQVVLAALDLLDGCGDVPAAVTAIEHEASDPNATSPRGWHRAAHALLALSKASPKEASEVVGRFVASPNPALKIYAARAAAELHDHASLEAMAADQDERVARIAREGLGIAADHPPTVPAASSPVAQPGRTLINAADLQRLTSSRARVTIRGVGSIELALLTNEAPVAVLSFARLVEAGFFNGKELTSVSPFLVGLPSIDAGSPELVTPRAETGSWPHVRGAVGIAADASATDGAPLFIDLMDRPAFDYVHPVFAHVLNGMDVLDQLLEGDVIERIEIVTGS